MPTYYSFTNLKLIAFSVLSNTITMVDIINTIPVIIPANGPMTSIIPKIDIRLKIIPDLIICFPE